MTDQKTIDALLYRIARHRSMGHGTICQRLTAQLRALRAAQ